MTNFEELAYRFDGPGVRAVVLMGSYARGDAGHFSDVDLVRITGGQDQHVTQDGSYLFDGRLVVVSSAGPAEVEAWFVLPQEAVNAILGLRVARALIDRQGTFAAIQTRAQAFVWDDSMQAKADAWASRQLVGWIEEVHKGLEGLRRNDTGRLLNARFGLSWGLSRAVCVQRGVLLSGDNAFYDEVGNAVGAESDWYKLRRIAYGIGDEGEGSQLLRDQVVAGLRLYVVTVEMLADALRPEDQPKIANTVDLIEKTLGHTGRGFQQTPP